MKNNYGLKISDYLQVFLNSYGGYLSMYVDKIIWWDLQQVDIFEDAMNKVPINTLKRIAADFEKWKIFEYDPNSVAILKKIAEEPSVMKLINNKKDDLLYQYKMGKKIEGDNWPIQVKYYLINEILNYKIKPFH